MSLEITTLQLDKICRICLCEKELESIFSMSMVDDDSICMAEILTFCASIEIAENDGLPNKICIECCEELKKFYKFKRQCRTNDETLRYYLNLTEIDIKQEASNSEHNLEIEESINENEKNKSNDEEWAWELENASEKKCKLQKTVSEKEKSLICRKCDIIFESPTELQNHRSTIKHPRERNHICHICKKMFTATHLKIHMRTHTFEKPFQCEACGQKFSLNCNLRRHMMIHTGEKPHRCHLCGKGFIQATTLNDHLRVHSGETPFICSICGKSFTQNGQLRLHLKRHEGETGKNSTNTRKFKVQIKGEYKCTECYRIFTTKLLLRRHEATHGDKKFLCSYCGKGFFSMALLKSHSIVHTEVKPYSCETCGKNFSRVGNLRTHSVIHTGEKRFICKICNHAFKQRTHLRYHLKIHSGERSYSCSVCGKSFALNGNLTVHMRIHTGERPYLCPVCGKGFRDSSSMNKHKSRHEDQI